MVEYDVIITAFIEIGSTIKLIATYLQLKTVPMDCREPSFFLFSTKPCTLSNLNNKIDILKQRLL
jgi:hypothetical protein